MKIAENRVAKPLLNRTGTASNIWAQENAPKFAIAHPTDGIETLTFAFVTVPLDVEEWLSCLDAGVEYTKGSVVIVGGSLLNPLDQLNRKVGRKEAQSRLEAYLVFGAQKRHKDGRKADHFVVELTHDEIKSGWQARVADLMFAGTFIPKQMKELEKLFASTDDLHNTEQLGSIFH